MSALAINPVHRVVRFYEAPIGKKALMAVTGAILFGYVVAHLLGNLQIYGDPQQINKYAAFLHNPANAGLLWVARGALLAAVGLHILASLQRNGGNKARTAEVLGISEKTLYNKLNRYAAEARSRAVGDEGEAAPVGAKG